MKFESVEHAQHYAAGNDVEIVIYKNKVIDVTEFKDKHPGGVESIMKHVNKDVTSAFDKIESHQTKTAIRDLESFCIGEIKLNKDNQVILKESGSHYDIDLKKGVLWQVFTKLKLKEYLEFTHDPKHMINPPEAILFDTWFLEIFTKTPWFVIPILWSPVVFYDLYYSYMNFDFTMTVLILYYLVGIFIWTLTEYLLHRFFFHIDEGLPDNRYFIMLHFLFHGIHHAFPMDKNRLVFPPVAAFPLYKLIIFVLTLVFGKYYNIFAAGVITGYIMYDMSHYFIHHNKPAQHYFKDLKAYHVLHHYKNPKRGFGVSNKIWDYVCNTVLYADDKKEVTN